MHLYIKCVCGWCGREVNTSVLGEGGCETVGEGWEAGASLGAYVWAYNLIELCQTVPLFFQDSSHAVLRLITLLGLVVQLLHDVVGATMNPITKHKARLQEYSDNRLRVNVL